MTTTQLSIETAPRDLEALAKQGRFNLRMLAEELGVFGTEASKQSFMGMSSEQQAENLLKLLQERDKPAGKGGGGGAAAGAGKRTPTTAKADAAKNGKATGGAATGAGGGTQAAPAGENAGKLLEKLDAILKAQEELATRVDELTGAVEQLQSVGAGTNRFVTVAIGLSLKLAEQVLNAGPSQVLKAVMDDMPEVEAALAELAPAEDADEEEAGEGEE